MGVLSCAKFRRKYSAPAGFVWGSLIVRSCAAQKNHSEKKSALAILLYLKPTIQIWLIPPTDIQLKPKDPRLFWGVPPPTSNRDPFLFGLGPPHTNQDPTFLVFCSLLKSLLNTSKPFCKTKLLAISSASCRNAGIPSHFPKSHKDKA